MVGPRSRLGMAIVVMLLIALTGVSLGRVYNGPLLAALITGAALGAVLVSTLLRRWSAAMVAPVSVACLTGYVLAAMSVSARASGVDGDMVTLVVDAARNAVPRLLTAMIPVEAQPDTVLGPVVLAWLAGFAGAEFAVRSGRAAVALVPPTLLYAGALVLVGPNADVVLWQPVLFAGIAALGLAASGGGSGEGDASGWGPRERRRLRRHTAGAAGAGLLIVLGFVAFVGPWVAAAVSRAPGDPRRYVQPPSLDVVDQNPLIRISGWAANPDQRLFDVTVLRGAPVAQPDGGFGGHDTRLRLAVLTNWDGVTWHVEAEYRNAGRVLPTPAGPGPVIGEEKRAARHDRGADHGGGTAGSAPARRVGAASGGWRSGRVRRLQWDAAARRAAGARRRLHGHLAQSRRGCQPAAGRRCAVRAGGRSIPRGGRVGPAGPESIGRTGCRGRGFAIPPSGCAGDVPRRALPVRRGRAQRAFLPQPAVLSLRRSAGGRPAGDIGAVRGVVRHVGSTAGAADPGRRGVSHAGRRRPGDRCRRTGLAGGPVRRGRVGRVRSHAPARQPIASARGRVPTQAVTADLRPGIPRAGGGVDVVRGPPIPGCGSGASGGCGSRSCRWRSGRWPAGARGAPGRGGDRCCGHRVGADGWTVAVRPNGSSAPGRRCSTLWLWPVPPRRAISPWRRWQTTPMSWRKRRRAAAMPAGPDPPCHGWTTWPRGSTTSASHRRHSGWLRTPKPRPRAKNKALAYARALRARRPWWRRLLWSIDPRPLRRVVADVDSPALRRRRRRPCGEAALLPGRRHSGQSAGSLGGCLFALTP